MVFVPFQCPNKQSLPGCEHLTMAEALLLGPECPLPDTCRVLRGGQFSQEGGPEEEGTSQHLSHSLPPLCSQHEASTHTGLLACSLGSVSLCFSVYLFPCLSFLWYLALELQSSFMILGLLDSSWTDHKQSDVGNSICLMNSFNICNRP